MYDLQNGDTELHLAVCVFVMTSRSHETNSFKNRECWRWTAEHRLWSNLHHIFSFIDGMAIQQCTV